MGEIKGKGSKQGGGGGGLALRARFPRSARMSVLFPVFLCLSFQ